MYANSNQTRLSKGMIGIGKGSRQGITKHCCRFIEVYTMLLAVGIGFDGIPGEFQKLSSSKN
ncbi:MAG: hypothetical protein Q8N96_05260 [Methylovulum sp.]|nr:hypothetical protein [Methylovulum sp.]